MYETSASQLGISLSNYAHGSGFADDAFSAASSAATTPAQLNELIKALEARDVTGREVTDSTVSSGAPLKTESLERSLKLITFKESDIRFWKRMPKAAAYNTVEEFNQLKSYGADRGGFNNEGELPEAEDSQYVRRAQLVKFLGVTKEVTHQMQLVNTHIGSIMQRETTNGIMWILRKVNKALFHADESIISQEFNGLYKQHSANDEFSTLDQYQDSEVVIDLRGKVLKEGNIEEAAQAIIRNFGYGNLLVAPPVVLSDFVKTFHDSKLIQPNTEQVTAGVMGQRVQKFQSQYGQIDLEYDIFAAHSPARFLSGAALSSKAPSAPTRDADSAASTVAGARFADGAGDYYYAVAAINRYGESALTSLDASDAAVTVGTGDLVTLDFSATAGTYAATGYVIYRSEVDAPGVDATVVPLYPIFSISVAQLAAGFDGGAATLVLDKNRYIAACEEAFLVQGDNEVIEFKQLAPLMKMPLARLSPADRFMVLLYGTPFLYAPKKMVRYINIGRDAS